MNPQSESLPAVQQVLKAAHYAAGKHSAQRRKGATAEPYLNHLVEVARLVAEALPEPDTNLVIAALLHDVIEDADVAAAELNEMFGPDVTSLVLEVTDDKSLPKVERKRLQVVNAPKKSKRAQMIKIADKISNLKGMISSPPAEWTLERRREYFHWAQDVVNGLSSPNPVLKNQFQETVRIFHELVGDRDSK